MGFLKEQYHLVYLFLKEKKGYFIISMILFFLSIMVSAFVLWQYPHLIERAIAFVTSVFQDAIKSIDTKNDAFLYIFFNNIRAIALMILWGVIPFLFLPLISLTINGVMLTFAWHLGAIKAMSTTTYLAHILPHGIIEIPLIWLSSGLGCYLCITMIQKIFSNKPLKESLINILRTYLLIILPLTLIAAANEAYITPIIGNFFI